MNNYKKLTVRELMEIVINDAKSFPKGLETVITTGDFEGNYTHRKHEVMCNSDDKSTVFLGYEMHEGFAE